MMRACSLLSVLALGCSSAVDPAAPAMSDGGLTGDAASAREAAAPGADAAPSFDAAVADAAMADAPSDASAGDPRGVFVAVGYGGRRMRSVDDGATWTDDQALAANGGDDMNLLRTIAFGNGRFIAAGWQTMSSPDGKTWTPLPATHQNWFGALAYARASWVAVGGYGMRLTSADATTWADHSVDTVAAHPHGCLVVVPGSNFVACNDAGKRSWSADGATWTYATGAESVVSSQLAVGAGVVVGIDAANVVVSRDAGKTWTAATALDAPGEGLVFANGRFTFLASGAVFTSSDGTQWTKHAAANARPSALAYGHGTYVAVRGHEWQRSTDGLGWAAPIKDAKQDNAFEWVAFGAATP